MRGAARDARVRFRVAGFASSRSTRRSHRAVLGFPAGCSRARWAGGSIRHPLRLVLAIGCWLALRPRRLDGRAAVLMRRASFCRRALHSDLAASSYAQQRANRPSAVFPAPVACTPARDGQVYVGTGRAPHGVRAGRRTAVKHTPPGATTRRARANSPRSALRIAASRLPRRSHSTIVSTGRRDARARAPAFGVGTSQRSPITPRRDRP